MRLANIQIGDGHKYQVRVNGCGKVMATACEGRWTMTSVPTGDAWLDTQLQRHANLHFYNDANGSKEFQEKYSK